MLKHPELPPEHCANQSPEMAKKVFVQSIAPSLKSGSMDARGAISQLEIWREYHPEVFADWRELCLTYIQQPPEWVDWLVLGLERQRASSPDSAKQPLNLVMPPSWWQWLGEWADQSERGVGILGTDPEPWEVLTALSEAIRSQFSSEGGSDE